MAEAWKKLAQGQLPSTVGTIYTVPASTETIIKHIVLSNPTGSDRTAALWHDGTTDAFNILPPTTIVAGTWAEFDGVLTLEAGDTIAGDSDAATAVTFTIYGLEIS